MALPGWDEVKELLVSVAKLTGNVSTLQEQMERTNDRVAALQSEVRALSADLRVARAELETEATRAAVQTVVQTYDGMSRRVMEVEDGLKRLRGGSAQIADDGANDASG